MEVLEMMVLMALQGVSLGLLQPSLVVMVMIIMAKVDIRTGMQNSVSVLANYSVLYMMVTMIILTLVDRIS